MRRAFAYLLNVDDYAVVVTLTQNGQITGQEHEIFKLACGTHGHGEKAGKIRPHPSAMLAAIEAAARRI